LRQLCLNLRWNTGDLYVELADFRRRRAARTIEPRP